MAAGKVPTLNSSPEHERKLLNPITNYRKTINMSVSYKASIQISVEEAEGTEEDYISAKVAEIQDYLSWEGETVEVSFAVTDDA